MKKHWVLAAAWSALVGGPVAVGAVDETKPATANAEATAAPAEKAAGKPAEKAMENADKSAAEPATAKGWFQLGHQKMESGDLTAAADAFMKAKDACRPENKKDRAWAMNNVGLCEIRGEKWDDARAALEEATQLDPMNATAWNNLGTVYLHSSDYDKAVDAFGGALKVNPDSSKAKANLAYAKSMAAEGSGGSKPASSSATTEKTEPKTDAATPASSADAGQPPVSKTP